MKRPLIIWFICTILFVLCYLLGCRTGGKSLGSGSAGTVIKGKTGQQINREASRFRQAQPVKSTPIKSAPVKSKPIEVKGESLKPRHLPPPPIKHEPLRPLNPTLAPLPPIKIEELPLMPLISPKSIKIEEKVNVTPINQQEKGGEKVEKSVNSPIIDKGKKTMDVSWLNLFIFYLLGFVSVLVGWLLYREWRKSDSALCLCGRLWGCLSRWWLGLKMLFAGWWQGIKNWWNDKPVKAAPKKTAKKKVGRTRKKKIAGKGERKSRLAANKKPKKKG